MAQSTSQSSSLNQAEGTWLLPSNRKLRNLVSISLRNISLADPCPSRSRSKAIDDDALPQTLKSPAKLVALREQKALGHSRSSTDLHAVLEEAATHSAATDEAVVNGSPVAGEQKQRTPGAALDSPRRPEFKRLRRRSTIEWANATPQKRQERLENMTKERMADVFFSVHVKCVEEPVYVSETVQKTMNPTFRHIAWLNCGPGVTRRKELSLRVWARGAKLGSWQQLLHLKLELSALQYLGRSLDDLDRSLPQNAVLFHMIDGIYTSFSDSLSDYGPPGPDSSQRKKTAASQRSLPTSSFDALLRLSKLDDSIQDALATRDQLAHGLEVLLQNNRQALCERDEVAETEDRLMTIDYAKKTVEKQLEKAQKQQEEKRQSLSVRRRLMKTDSVLRGAIAKKMRQDRSDSYTSRDEHDATRRAVQNQRRRVCEDIQRCYPIETVDGKTLGFSIRELHLPNSEDLDLEQPEVVSAALGHVAHVLQLLAFYLKQNLPYPVIPRGSNSTVYDPISLLQHNSRSASANAEQTLRTYPLFSKSVPRFRFEYAVFLLNQDIRVLLESAYNLRVLDIRQTLPNLKYLLFVATAGEGELPARKAGGVRGLMRVPALERSGSQDSTASGMSGLTLIGNGKPRGAADRLREISGKGKNAVPV
ncbi:hypothetical protein DOTSEDRAFT_69766 [Dothistroma septosporum NZE10]|uniref:Autophagy-related protein 14 n=1 Tax=Dothistroma septosporum (strain NZE10 / CBS 128990) TaxID=675120 RepID=N1PWM3_DOTSN|nr:hypothetical protein DOTSEDRAFT_69766 [Dothistroma septosporum NZE10]